MYEISSNLFEIDHRLRKAPKPIPNFEAKPLLARLVLPWGTRWESRVLISPFFCHFLPTFKHACRVVAIWNGEQERQWHESSPRTS